MRAATIVDAGGHRQPTRPSPAPGTRAEQTAHGVVLDEAAAEPLVASGEALFMDWRPDHGETGWPTFLYAVPLGGGRVLLEETSLARRPGLPQPVLRRRLLARLARHGITVPDDAPVERVRFPVDTPRLSTPGVVGFGAAAPLVHPASGFSVATALSLAPSVAAAIVDGSPAGVVWSPQARAVHRFRRIGLEALLRMPPADVPDFFEVFFSLPGHHRWTYLGGRDDLPGTMAVMGALFGRAGWRLRSRLVMPALRPAAPPRPAEEAAPIR
jgi:lycopene beta-cyclase